MQALAASQQTSQNAAAYLAAQATSQHFTGPNTEAFRTRLSALDEMTAASRSALYRAPQMTLFRRSEPSQARRSSCSTRTGGRRSASIVGSSW